MAALIINPFVVSTVILSIHCRSGRRVYALANHKGTPYLDMQAFKEAFLNCILYIVFRQNEQV